MHAILESEAAVDAIMEDIDRTLDLLDLVGEQVAAYHYILEPVRKDVVRFTLIRLYFFFVMRLLLLLTTCQQASGSA